MLEIPVGEGMAELGGSRGGQEVKAVPPSLLNYAAVPATLCENSDAVVCVCVHPQGPKTPAVRQLSSRRHGS